MLGHDPKPLLAQETSEHQKGYDQGFADGEKDKKNGNAPFSTWMPLWQTEEYMKGWSQGYMAGYGD